MSDALQAIDQAIQRYVAEEGEGRLVEAWVIVCHSLNVDDSDPLSGYRYITSDTQPHHVDVGLIEVGKTLVRESWDEYLHEEDDD